MGEVEAWTAATYKTCFLSRLQQQTAKENSRCLILETISFGTVEILHPCCIGIIKLSLVQIVASVLAVFTITKF